MKSTLTKDLNFIEKAGFDHIKVELEGSLGRGGGKCYDCKGNGKGVCSTCTGRGVVAVEPNEKFPEATLAECHTCKGDAVSICAECGGRGSNHKYTNTSECFSWLMKVIALAITGKDIDTLRKEVKPSRRVSGHGGYEITDHKLIPGLAYAEFYNDGSVDSELTFTVHKDHVKDLPIYINAFNKLAQVAGRGHIDVAGAGMHISVIPTAANGNYPTSTRLPSDKVANFRENMGKLLPALYFVAAAGATTRGFNYRHARVSNSEKYSAIYTHGGTCFEYRVFDTCYQRPEAIFEFIGVIAKSLKFYDDTSYKVKELKQTFSFASGRNVVGFFDNPSNLRVLNAQIKYLKPECATYKELKKARGVHINLTALTKKKKENLANLRKSYEKYKNEWQRTWDKPLDTYEQRDRDYYMTDENLGLDLAEDAVRSRRIGSMLSFSQYLDKNIARKSSQASVTV